MIFEMHLILASLSRLHGEGEFITEILETVTQGASPLETVKVSLKSWLLSQIFVN